MVSWINQILLEKWIQIFDRDQRYEHMITKSSWIYELFL